jgi:tetratricopeptide (TPR) repeat protein
MPVVWMTMLFLGMPMAHGRADASERSQLLVAMGDEAYAAGRYARAAEAYRQAMFLDARDVAAHYGFGLTRVQAADWMAAASAFERALALRPGFGAARRALAYVELECGREALDADQIARAAGHFDRAAELLPAVEGLASSLAGEAYVHLGDTARARERFERAARSADLATARRARARLQRLTEGVLGRWEIDAATAIGYDSNVAIEPDRRDLRLEDDPGDVEFLQRVHVGYDFLEDARWDGRLDGEIEQTLHPVLSDFDLRSERVDLTVRRRMDERWWAAIVADVLQYDLANDGYLREVGGGPVLSLLAAETALWGTLQGTHLDYLSAPFEDSRDGWRKSVEVGIERRVGSWDAVRLTYEYLYEEPGSAAGDDFEYGGNRIGLGVRRPWWWRSELTLAYAWLYADYPRLQSVTGFRTTRVDSEHYVAMTIERQICSWLWLALEGEATFNHSNIDLYSYQRLAGGLRAEVHF